MSPLLPPFPKQTYAKIVWGKYRTDKKPKKLMLSKSMTLKVLTQLKLISSNDLVQIEKQFTGSSFRIYCNLDRYWTDMGLHVAVMFREAGITSLYKRPGDMAYIYTSKLFRDPVKLKDVRQVSFYATFDTLQKKVEFIFPYHDEYVEFILGKKRKWFGDINEL